MSWTDKHLPDAQTKCEYCGHEGVFPHFGTYEFGPKEYSLYRCPDCGSLMYYPLVVPVRNESDMSPQAVEHYGIGNRYYLEIGFSVDHVVKCAMMALAGVPHEEQPRHLFVDIGAGIGMSSVFARPYAKMETLTVEPSPTAHTGIKLFGLNTYQAMIEDLPADVLARMRERPSVLHLNSVVEHIAHPEEALRSIMALTDVESIGIVVPDGAAIDREVPFLMQLPLLAPSDHMHLPTVAGVTKFFHRLGLPEVQIDAQNGLMVATGARRPFVLPTQAEQDAARDDFLEELARHPDPPVADGARARIISYAAQRDDPAGFDKLLASLGPGFEPAALMRLLHEESSWEKIPFYIGPTAFWVAYEALRHGHVAKGEQWCDVLELFAERMASDQMLYASTSLHYRVEARILRGATLLGRGRNEEAAYWLDRVLAPAPGESGGPNPEQRQRAQGVRARIPPPRPRQGLFSRLSTWVHDRTGH